MAELTIKLDPETVVALAEELSKRLGVVTITPGNPPPPNTQAVQTAGFSNPQSFSPQADADPWQAQAAPSVQPAPAPVAAQPSAPTASPAASGPPNCKHGPMKWVGPGVVKSGPRAGQPRGPFWACPTAQGAPDKCPADFTTPA